MPPLLLDQTDLQVHPPHWSQDHPPHLPPRWIDRHFINTEVEPANQTAQQDLEFRLGKLARDAPFRTLHKGHVRAGRPLRGQILPAFGIESVGIVAPIAGQTVDGVDGDQNQGARPDRVGPEMGGRAGLPHGERDRRNESETFPGDRVEVGQPVRIWEVFLAGHVFTSRSGQEWHVLPYLFSQFDLNVWILSEKEKSPCQGYGRCIVAASNESSDLVFERRECHLAFWQGDAFVRLDDKGHDVFLVCSSRLVFEFAIYYDACLSFDDLSRLLDLATDTYWNIFQVREKESKTLNKIVFSAGHYPVRSVDWRLWVAERVDFDAERCFTDNVHCSPCRPVECIDRSIPNRLRYELLPPYFGN